MQNNLIKGIITSKERKIIENLYQDEEIQDFIYELKTFCLKYEAAMKDVENKIRILNRDFEVRYNHCPIEYVKTRIKSPESLMKKMIRNGISFNLEDVENNIFDIAGVRIICSFVSDIFNIVEIVRKYPEIEVIREKDYINNPKESGYRSYHMILKVPVYLTTGKEEVFVELQIRTMAMDFWASLEHKIKYKYDGIIPEDVKKELVDCSNSISESDSKMMNLNEKVKDINRRLS